MQKSIPSPPSLQALFSDHDRHWRDFSYVYPVLSRRSGGLSIGINLNPDKVCNFDCVYCSVDRREPPRRRDVDETQVLAELSFLLDFSRSGEIYRTAEFADVPPAWRRVNDVAFSGDGEPTAYPGFPNLVSRVAELLRGKPDGNQIKIVLITNATLLHRPSVQAALRVMDENRGEVWAKLDAGTEAYFQRINRTAVPFSRVLENIRTCALARPTVIQSLFMKIQDRGPSPAEIDAYVQRLQDLVAAGGNIKLVQVYTVARSTAESNVNILSSAELEAIAQKIRAALPGIAVEVYGGVPIVRPA